MVVKNIIQWFLSFLQWIVPWFLASIALEMLTDAFHVEENGLKWFLNGYYFVICAAFVWRLYDGLYRTCDFWIDPKHPY